MSKFINDIELDDLLLFLETGNMQDAPPEIVEYVMMLDKIWGMHKRMLEFPNNESIINHLVLVNGLNRQKARQLVKDTLMYFHTENNLPKETWRSIIADKGLKSFTASIRLAKTARDFKDAFSILIELGKFMGWDNPEQEKPDENFLRQLQIVSADPTMFDLPQADRRAIGRFIDDLPDVPELVKKKAKKEVDGVPFKMLYKDGE